MTAKQFFDWQTAGGTNDVMRLVDCLERADIAWCAIGGIAVNHWAAEPMVTQDVDFVVATDAVERTISLLEDAGFRSERFDWSVNFKGQSRVSIQLSTEEFYRDFPSRAGPGRPMCTVSCSASPVSTIHYKTESRPGAIPATGRASESRTSATSPASSRPIPTCGTP